jgi:hypothetical protein
LSEASKLSRHQVSDCIHEFVFINITVLLFPPTIQNHSCAVLWLPGYLIQPMLLLPKASSNAEVPKLQEVFSKYTELPHALFNEKDSSQDSHQLPDPAPFSPHPFQDSYHFQAHHQTPAPHYSTSVPSQPSSASSPTHSY